MQPGKLNLTPRSISRMRENGGAIDTDMNMTCILPQRHEWGGQPLWPIIPAPRPYSPGAHFSGLEKPSHPSTAPAFLSSPSMLPHAITQASFLRTHIISLRSMGPSVSFYLPDSVFPSLGVGFTRIKITLLLCTCVMCLCTFEWSWPIMDTQLKCFLSD